MLASRPRIRRLSPANMRQVERFLLSLDAEDRHARFHLAVSDWWISAYVHALDPARVTLIGAFSDTHPATLIALAEAHPVGSAAAAEMAVVVHPSYRRAGIATRLVLDALRQAFAAGAQAAEFAYAPGNLPLIALLNSLGAKVRAVRGHAVIERATLAETLPRAA